MPLWNKVLPAIPYVVVGPLFHIGTLAGPSACQLREAKDYGSNSIGICRRGSFYSDCIPATFLVMGFPITSIYTTPGFPLICLKAYQREPWGSRIERGSYPKAPT